MISVRGFCPLFTAGYLLILMMSAGGQLNAQMLHSPSTLGLGGGGTANISGHEALFVNPANLHIREQAYRIQISAGSFGLQVDAPYQQQTPRRLRSYYLELTEGVSPEFSNPVGYEPESLLERNFRGDRLISEHLSSGEIQWFGIHWSGHDRSYALAARTRFANRFGSGRGFYDLGWISGNEGPELNRSLMHHFQSLHEISVGYGESFTLLSGLIPHMSRFMIGIAPKLVLPGALHRTDLEERYLADETKGTYLRHRSYEQMSTGRLSEWYGGALDPMMTIQRSMDRRELFRPAGFGAGLDFGLTWMTTLGDDLSFARELQQETRRSLRISISITDLGFVRYRRDPLRLSDRQVIEEQELPGRADQLFTGRPGEHMNFLSDHGSIPWEDTDIDTDDLTLMLPTSFNTGFLLQIGRIKLMSDITFGLTNDAFQTTRPVTYLGTEVRPVSWLPLRAGTRLVPGRSDYWSLGLGVETGSVELGFSVQFRSQSGRPTGEPSGASFGSLRINLH